MDEHMYHNPSPQPPLSKSSPISSPPQSPDRFYPSDDATRQTNPQSHPGLYSQSSLYTAPQSGHAPKQPSDAVPVKKPRKKKETGVSSAQDAEVKQKKPRKPREPRDPNAPPRKKAKKNEEAETNGHRASSRPAEPYMTTNENRASYGFGPTLTANNSSMQNGHQQHPLLQAPGYAQIIKAEADTNQHSHYLSTPQQQLQQQQQQLQQQPPRPQPHLGVQRYDPIRSASAENARLAATPTPTSAPSAPAYALTAFKDSGYGRGSPSGASLLGQAVQSQTTAPPHHRSTPPPPQASAEPRRETPIRPAPAPVASVETRPNLSGEKLGHPQEPVLQRQQPLAEKPVKRAISPKPPRKRATPPVAMGNGLLSGADFGRKGPSEVKEYAQVPNQCIVIDVPIKHETGNYINFLHEVEKKYGFDVAHPRIAEHRRRMAEMAAAGAMIESGNGTADDMSLDLSEPDSDAGMGGVTEDSDAKKKRKSRMDAYDIADDFIDDTEQAWEEQALASKDGYFVWSGPLIQEGDNPTVERADGTVKRGRGGRGRGGSIRGASTRGRGDGAGKGARGATTTRKPRMKKAERMQMEQDKLEREKAAASLPTTMQFPGVVGAS